MDAVYKEMVWKMGALNMLYEVSIDSSNLIMLFAMPMYYNLGELQSVMLHKLYYICYNKLHNHLLLSTSNPTRPHMLTSIVYLTYITFSLM